MSLLGGLDRSVVVRDPFPHLVVEGALDQETCRRLVREFPPLRTFTRGRAIPGNAKLQRRSPDLLADPGLAPAWRAVIEEHLRPETLVDMLRLFGDEVRREYPDFEERFGKLDALRVGRRGRDSYHDHDVLLDAQLIVHTPVVGRPSVERAPHVKGPEKLLEGHLFLRGLDDDTPGGEIELFAIRPGFEPVFRERGQTCHEYLRLVRSIPYRRNTFVCWLATPRSIQQVAIRGPSRHPFQFMGVLAELPRPLFDLGDVTGPWRRLVRTTTRWTRRARSLVGVARAS